MDGEQRFFDTITSGDVRCAILAGVDLDGRAFGVELNYVNEDLPLVTGGALGLMPPPQEPVLVINGDILTQVDFRAMLAYHQEQRAEMTVPVCQYDL